MRISDWSSDVCSSDLHAVIAHDHHRLVAEPGDHALGLVAQPHAVIAVVDRDAAEEAHGVLVDRQDAADRKSVVEGKSVSVRVDLGGRRIIKKNTSRHNMYISQPNLQI